MLRLFIYIEFKYIVLLSIYILLLLKMKNNVNQFLKSSIILVIK